MHGQPHIRFTLKEFWGGARKATSHHRREVETRLVPNVDEFRKAGRYRITSNVFNI